ncbi:hypothetical protein IFR05_011228 [Cadophora sp. M221]|nr:hypothetical protein IFR05_011228 [Cadophora sp. M221]
MPGSKNFNGKKKRTGKAAGTSSSSRSQSGQETSSPSTNPNNSFAVQEPNVVSADAIDDGASDVSLEPIYEGLEKFATSTSNTFTTPNGSFAVQEPNARSADVMDDGASDVSLEPIFEGLERSILATSTSNSTFNHLTTPAQTNGNIYGMKKMVKGMVSGLPLPPQVGHDDGFVDFAANLLASIPITQGLKSQSTTAALPARMAKLIASLPEPPTTPLPASSADWGLISKPLDYRSVNTVNNYTNFADALGGWSSSSGKKRTSTKSVGKMVKRLVLSPKGKKRKYKKSKQDSEDTDEQTLLDIAIQMSLAEDEDNQARLDLAMEESLVEKAMEESALDMRVEDQDVAMTEAEYASTKLDEWVSENQANFGAATSHGLQSDQTATEDSPTEPYDAAHRARLQQIAIDTLAFMEKQEDEFAAGMMSVVSPTLPESLPLPTSPATSVTSPTSAVDSFIRKGPFNFKGLDLKIRNEIYKLLVVIRPTAYATTSSRTLRQLRFEPHIARSDTAIFFTDKKISEESRTVFYTFNFFTVGCGLYGATNQTNLHGLEEFIEIVPRRFRLMVRNLEMEIVLPVGWLNQKRSGLDRDREERHLQTKLLALGRLLKKKFKGVENVQAEFRTDGSIWGSLQAWHEGWAYEIEIGNEEKLSALRGLLQFPGLHSVRVGNMGPMCVNSAFMNIAQKIVDDNDAARSRLKELQEGGTVMEAAEMKVDKVMGGDTIEEGAMAVESEIKEDTGALSKDVSCEGKRAEGSQLDGAWENPYAVEGNPMQIELRDNDTSMENAEAEEESIMACFGIE